MHPTVINSSSVKIRARYYILMEPETAETKTIDRVFSLFSLTTKQYQGLLSLLQSHLAKVKIESKPSTVLQMFRRVFIMFLPRLNLNLVFSF